MNRAFIITPSYLIRKKRDFDAGVAQLSKLGFHVINPDFPKLLPSPPEKAEQIHRAFLDPDIDIIIALRGGYGAMKLLPLLDFALIKEHPKIIAGFSDVTALLNPLAERTGMVTLHGPMIVSFNDPTDFTLRSFLNASHGYPQRNLFKGAPVTVYNPGTATGVLKGGNLVTLNALIGTDWETDADNAILFLEDVDEKLHKIDRCLTQWILTGKLRGVKGIILGDFGGIKSREIYQILSSQIELTVPVVHCPFIGHVKKQITLPVGAEVELDTEKKQLLIKNMTFPGAQS